MKPDEKPRNLKETLLIDHFDRLDPRKYEEIAKIFFFWEDNPHLTICQIKKLFFE